MAYKPPQPRPGLRQERGLLMDLKKGKAEAFDTFFEQHAAPLLRLATALAARPGPAAGIVEAAFRKALIRSAAWPEAQSLGAWLSAMVVEEGNRHLRDTAGKSPERPPRERRRRGGPRRERSRSKGPPEKPLPLRPVLDWSAAAGEEPLRTRLRELAAGAGPRLPELLRASWALVDGAGLSARQAGEVLCLSPAMVSSRVHRARLVIREDLARQAAGGPGEGGPTDTADGRPETGHDHDNGPAPASGGGGPEAGSGAAPGEGNCR
jgi:RNA polymerase sigma-70 factor (ECF subfamily)